MSLMSPRGAAVARVYLKKRDTYTGIHFDASYIESEVGTTPVLHSLHVVLYTKFGEETDIEWTF